MQTKKQIKPIPSITYNGESTMKRLCVAFLLLLGSNVHAAGGTGTVSSICAGLTLQQCADWVDATYNTPPGGTPQTPPPPPPPALTVSNLQVAASYDAGNTACLLYDYTVPNVATGTETRKVFVSDWSSVVSEVSSTASFPSSSNERCGQFTMPTADGDYIAQACLSVGTDTECASESFTIGTSSGGGGGGTINNGVLSLNWFDMYDLNWSSATVFPVNQDVPVLLGLVNGTSNTEYVWSEIKTFDGSWNLLDIQAKNVEMPANSTKDVNGDTPRFIVSFTSSGNKKIQVCAVGGCLPHKSVTITQ